MTDRSKHGRSAGMTRRQFLRRGSAAVAGAAAFPAIVPAAAIAQGDSAPSNRITLGFIGLGKQGRESHLGSLVRKPDVQILALCDVEKGRLERSKAHVEDTYAKRNNQPGYKGCDIYNHFEELIARDDIDALVIATPDHWHAIPCVAAAKAGKDIYCEKPLTRYIAEGRAIADAVAEYGRIFQTGSQQRSEYSGMFRRAAELVRAGALGDLESIEIGIGGPPGNGYELPPEPVPDTLDWDRWLGPAPWRPYSSTLCPLDFPGYPAWRYYRDYAGGSFSDFGAHHFDIAQWALDMDRSGPVEIIPPNGKDVDRLVMVYANGLPMYHGAEADCVFNGTKGRILVSRSFLRSEPESILRTPLSPEDDHLDRNRGHREDWLHCIRTREQCIADAETGHRTSTVCQLGNIAFQLNRPLRWNPESETFMNDEQANALCSRPMRGPWSLS